MANQVDWLFLDLNSFFASCEQQEHPELRGKPVAVLPVLAETTSAIAASYEAKRLGIKTNTRVPEMRAKCPDIALVKARPKKYVEYHHKILAAIDTCIPVDKVWSIDEVSCKLMGPQREVENAIKLAQKTKDAIKNLVGECLTSSVGLSSNTLLAKMAADMKKPDGLTVILPENLPHALHGLKLTDIPGVGRNMLKRLYAHSVYCMEDLLKLDAMRFRAIWGGVVGARYHAMLNGQNVAKPETKTSMIGHEHVLEPKARSRTAAFNVLQKLLVKAAERLRNSGYYCRCLGLHVKLAHHLGYFENKRTFTETQDTAFLLNQLARMWKEYPHEEPLRVGVSLHDLVAVEHHQMELFDAPRKEKVLKAIDFLNGKYGRGTISFGVKSDNKEIVNKDKIAFNRVPSLYEVT